MKDHILRYNYRFFLFLIMLLGHILPGYATTQAYWIDTLNNRAESYSINIYDPDDFLKDILQDTIKLDEYVRISEQNKDNRALSFAYNMYGKNRINISDYSAAIQYHSKAYNLALSVGDEYLEALSLNMMGVVYRRKSAIKSALDYYTRALRIAEKSEDRTNYMLKNIAISNEGIGGVYRRLGQYELAIQYYQQAYNYERRLNSYLGMAIDNHNIGKSFEFLGSLDSALFYHKQSLKYDLLNIKYGLKKDSSFISLGKAICYNSIGKVLLRMNKPDSAYYYFANGFHMSHTVGDSSYIINSNINLGWYFITQQLYDSACFYLHNGLLVAKRIGKKDALKRGYSLLSDLKKSRNQYQKSLDYYKLSVAYSDSIVNEKNQQYLVDLTILYDIEKKQRMIEKLQYKAQLSRKIQRGKNIAITLLGVVALVLIVLIFQKLQAIKKNRVIHNQKGSLLKLELELKALQNKQLADENKQKESEKKLLKEKLVATELARESEIKAMQNELDHKNRELAAAATYAIKKSESIRHVYDSIEQLKENKQTKTASLEKLQKDISEQMNPEADWENFSLHFETVHPSFFKKLKGAHPNITTNELRLSAYVLMNLSNKEIALLLYISNDAVQKAKYRLKKKFELTADDNLYEYLLGV